LIERGSTFFAGALGGQFSEAKSNTMDLPDEDPETFDLFVHWLYHSTLPPIPDARITDAAELTVAEWSYYGLYCLGEKWCINALKNQTIDRIREFHNSRATTIHPCHIESCYARTSESSLLRRYVIESTAFALRSPFHKAYKAELRAHVEDADFLYDLMDECMKLIDLGGFDNPNLRPHCDFHEPVQGNHCCITTDAVPADPGLEGAFYRVYLRDEELQQS